MELKDYLHLYLGCWVLVEHSNYYFVHVLNIHKGEKFLLNGFYYGCITDHGGDKLLFKPILRPLSDMTEEEAREFLGKVMNFNSQCNFGGWDWKYEKGFITVYNKGLKEWYTVIKPFGENKAPVFNCSYTMREGYWLIKNGFDVFGLIEAGLAIDLTTLNNQKQTT